MNCCTITIICGPRKSLKTLFSYILLLPLNHWEMRIRRIFDIWSYRVGWRNIWNTTWVLDLSSGWCRQPFHTRYNQNQIAFHHQRIELKTLIVEILSVVVMFGRWNLLAIHETVQLIPYWVWIRTTPNHRQLLVGGEVSVWSSIGGTLSLFRFLPIVSGREKEATIVKRLLYVAVAFCKMFELFCILPQLSLGLTLVLAQDWAA